MKPRAPRGGKAAVALGLVAVFGMAGCTEERTHGHYIDGAALRPGGDPEDRWGISAGGGFIVGVGHTLRSRLPLVSESTEQLDLWIELRARPRDGDAVDLSSARTRYELGRQALTWISEEGAGTLVVETHGGALRATIDASFSKPLLGDGERNYRGSVMLEKRAP